MTQDRLQKLEQQQNNPELKQKRGDFNLKMIHPTFTLPNSLGILRKYNKKNKSSQYGQGQDLINLNFLMNNQNNEGQDGKQADGVIETGSHEHNPQPQSISNIIGPLDQQVNDQQKQQFEENFTAQAQ